MYINKNNFEICSAQSAQTIEIDDLIYPSILLLNKKGYKTLACCAGHNKYEENIFEVTEEEIDEVKNHKLCTIISQAGNIYRVKSIMMGLSCYIKFADDIVLPSIPTSFEQINNAIYYAINFYDEDYSRKNNREIEVNILETNRLLLEWVNNLPLYKQKIH